MLSMFTLKDWDISFSESFMEIRTLDSTLTFVKGPMCLGLKVFFVLLNTL